MLLERWDVVKKSSSFPEFECSLLFARLDVFLIFLLCSYNGFVHIFYLFCVGCVLSVLFAVPCVNKLLC